MEPDLSKLGEEATISGYGGINPFGPTELVSEVQEFEFSKCDLCKAHVSEDDLQTHMAWHMNLANEVTERTKTNSPDGAML